MKRVSLVAAGLVTATSLMVAGAGAASAATTTAPSPQDVAFLKMSTTMDLEEIAGGVAAEKLGTYPATRAFGKRVATDHAKHYLQAAKIAKAEHVTLPTKVPASAIATLKAVMAHKGAAFDIAYLKVQTAGHFAAVGLTTQEIERGSDLRVVENAEAASPVIRYHLWRAQLDLRYELWDQGR